MPILKFVSKNLTKLIFTVMILGVANSYFFGGIPFNIVKFVVARRSQAVSPKAI
ncbi:MAG: hypothetical protein ACYCV0_04410 [Desulfitobacteriaceae bacterium]